MDDPEVSTICENEGCIEPVSLKASIFETMQEAEIPILCPSCYDAAVESKEAEEEIPQRYFEYKALYIVGSSMEGINELGADGWELITTSNGILYFKKEYYK